MERQEVEKILVFYKHIDLDIRIAGEWLERYEEEYKPIGVARYDERVENEGIKTDITSKRAAELAESHTKENINRLEKRIQELRSLKTEIFKEILKLNPIQKTIIFEFYLKEQKWERIAEQVNYSIRQSKNIRCAALKTLGEKFEGNKRITGSRIIDEAIK